MQIQLNNRVALVGGGSKGIGKAIATELANAGASVWILARNEADAKNVVSNLRSSENQKHGYVIADMAKPDEVEAKIKALIQHIGTIHILVNNTGGPASGPIIAASESEFLNAFTQHLVCNQIISKLLLPGMKEANYGRIINIISTSVKVPLHGLGVSNSIRGAVASWAKTWANECGKFGITVNNVLPGATKTDRLATIIQNKSEKLKENADKIEHEMLNEIPMGRFANPEEIAFAAVFLASDKAAYINGINLPVDGGRTGCL